MVTDNLKKVIERMENAAKRAGRNPEDITLIAVSKTKPVELIKQVYDAGIREFGENKVQEIDRKSEVLPKDIKWHMIGHLQRNKVKTVIREACLIHSVDSIRLAEQISKDAATLGISVPVLLEDHSLNDKKMPAEEETYINIDCLDEQTGEVLPLCKEEKHKVSPEELEARKNNFFMKIWNPLSGLVITIWKYLLRILNIIWGYIKKAGIFLKNRYVELKNKREKNK